MQQNRAANYDAIRVLQSFFVICVHTALPVVIEDNELLSNAIAAFLFQCNGVFFMLSGYFNLNKEFSNGKDYITFYLKRFSTIIIPYYVISTVYVVINCIQEDRNLNIKGYIWASIEAVISTNANSNSHLWFVCVLIGLLISTPFLSKMCHSMNKEEVSILFGVGMIWNIVSIYLTTNLGMPFYIRGWIFAEWAFIFVLGYICNRIVDDGNRKYFYVLGIIGFAISVFGKTYLEKFENANDLSAGYVMFVVAAYLFYEKHLDIKNRVFDNVVTYLSKYSYLSYMIHVLVLQNITKKLFIPQNSILEYIVSVSFTFVVSYLLAIIVCYLVVEPLQKIYWRIVSR